MVVSSKNNETIKYIRKLKEKKYRDINNEFIIEGSNLIKEAIQEKALIKIILVCEECIKKGNIDSKILYQIAKYNCIYVSEEIFDTVTDVKNHQGIMAVISKQNENNSIDFNSDIILVLENIQDPGNLGTILRTADSIGLKQIIVTDNTADVFNPKVVRSTMGAIFRVDILETKNLIATLEQIKKQKYKIYATSLNTDTTIYDVKYNKTAIIIGNEANGVTEDVLKMADKKIKIPMLRKN